MNLQFVGRWANGWPSGRYLHRAKAESAHAYNSSATVAHAEPLGHDVADLVSPATAAGGRC